MGNVAADVMIGTTGAVYYAAAGTTLPTSVSGSVAAFSELGYVSEDGVTWTPASTNSQVKAWQNGDVVNDSETEHTYQAEFTCLETNENVLALWYAGNYDTPAGRGVIKGGQTTRGAWVFDVVSGTDLERICIPDGKVIERKPVSWKNGEPIAYGFTLNCYADASGNKSYEYHSAAGAS